MSPSLLSLAIVLLTTSEDPSISALDLEQLVLGQRRSIQQAHIVLAQKRSSKKGKPAPTEREYEVWMDGERNRTEVRSLAPDGKSYMRKVYVRGADEGAFIYFDDTGEKGDNSAVEICPRDPKDTQQKMVIDPRMVGMYPIDVLNMSHFNLESVLARPDRRPPTLHEDQWKGHLCKRLEFDLNEPASSKWKVWIVPDWGYSIVRMTYEQKDNSGIFTMLLEAEVQPVKTGLWYPRSYRYERRDNGKLDESAEVEVKSVALNEDLPPDCFALKGMNISVGKAIYGQSADTMERWDGNKAVTGEELPITAKPPSRNYWLLAGALFLGAVAACAVWKYLRAKPSLAGR